jgi:hypothetical protein
MAQSTLTYRLYRRAPESDCITLAPTWRPFQPPTTTRWEGVGPASSMNGAGDRELIPVSPRLPQLGGLHDARHRCDLRDLDSGHLHHPLSRTARRATFRCGPSSMNAHNHARRLDDASTDFDVLEKSSPVKLVNYSRSWR